MLKRTKGRLLITLLVITGLAGTMKQNSLLPQERRLAVSMYKDNRADILNIVQKLTEQQLQFHLPESRTSIAAYLAVMNHTEKEVWALFEKTMKQPASPPEMRLAISFSDESILQKITTSQSLSLFLNTSLPAQPGKNGKEIVADFKAQRTAHIRYLRSSTEDLRNHIIQTPSGAIDCYQLVLLLAKHQEILADSIRSISQNHSFPTK